MHCLNDCVWFLLVCEVVALGWRQLPAVEHCRSSRMSGWSLGYPSARTCGGCSGKKPYRIWLIIVDRSKDFVLISSSLDRFEGCFLQICPHPFSVPTQLCEQGCGGGDVGNELRDIINPSIESVQFFLALWSCPVHYGPDFLWCRVDAIILYHCNMCTCSGNGTQERAVQDPLCLVDLYLVYLI